MSESESDPLNSIINPRGNVRMFIPFERAEAIPNISGFIDESPYRGPGMCLQSQWEGIEIRTDKVLNAFHRLQKNTNEWELSIRNFPHSAIEIKQRFNLLAKNIASLSNQALLAVVSTAIHRDISNLGDILTLIKLLGLRNVDSGIEQPVLRTDTQVVSSFFSITNLSITAPALLVKNKMLLRFKTKL